MGASPTQVGRTCVLELTGERAAVMQFSIRKPCHRCLPTVKPHAVASTVAVWCTVVKVPLALS